MHLALFHSCLPLCLILSDLKQCIFMETHAHDMIAITIKYPEFSVSLISIVMTNTEDRPILIE